MCESNVADIDPEEDSSRRQFLVDVLPSDEVSDAGVGRVDVFEGVEVVDDWAKDQRRVDRRDVEGGTFFFDEVPCCFFGEGLDANSRRR